MPAEVEGTPKTSFRRTLGQLGRLVPKGRRSRWWILAGFSVIAAVIEAVGGLLIFGVLELVQGGDSTVGEQVESIVQSFLPDASDSQVLTSVLIAAALFFVVRSLVLITLTYVQNRIAQSEAVRISRDLVGSYLAADYEYHLSSDPSVLIRNSMVSVDDATIRFLVPVARIASESLTVTALVAVLLFSAPVVTMYAVVLIGVAAWIVMRVVRPRFHRIGRINQDLTSDLLGTLTEAFEGIRDVIVGGGRRRYLGQFTRARSTLAKTRVLRFTLEAVPRYFLETLLMVGVLVFLSIEVSRDASTQSISLIGLFAYTALRTLPAINRITASVNKIRFAQAAVDDVLEDLDSVPTADRLAGESADPIGLNDAIQLSGVSFGYGGSDRRVIDGIDLRIGAGESLGIAGPTGSGKSTLVDILLGLLTPDSGIVQIDGKDLTGIESGWHQTIGVVSQKVFLANGTITRNVAMSDDERSVNLDRVRECLEMAQLKEFVDELPDGVDTTIGGSGIRVSGGERQRLAIARALYRRPQVLFLDEATSAVDGSTEASLIDAIIKDDPDRTLIMIAHRTNTLRDCDRIIVLVDGQIHETGTFDSLVANSDLFARMSRGGHK